MILGDKGIVLMSNKNPRLDGKLVYLEEIQPKYFQCVIDWRNNTDNNMYLNQPFKLNMELQTKWYEDKYIKDFTQGLYVMVDKATNKPFGTIGWTDYDIDKKVCIAGRLLVGEIEYRGSNQWKEAAKLVNDYLYYVLGVEEMYAHVVIQNVVSRKWHKKWGYEENDLFVFPDEQFVNGMEQREYIRRKDGYMRILNMI